MNIPLFEVINFGKQLHCLFTFKWEYQLFFLRSQLFRLQTWSIFIIVHEYFIAEYISWITEITTNDYMLMIIVTLNWNFDKITNFPRNKNSINVFCSIPRNIASILTQWNLHANETNLRFLIKVSLVTNEEVKKNRLDLFFSFYFTQHSSAWNWIEIAENRPMSLVNKQINM